jgi:hypothetical protein
MSDHSRSLRMFVEVLELLSDGLPVDHLKDVPDMNIDVAFVLLNGLFIDGTDVATSKEKDIMNARITPKGALALLQWKDELYNRSSAAKAKKVLWFIGGITASGAAQIGVSVIQELVKSPT